MKAEFWAVDTFRFSVTGPGTFRFLNRAAASGVRLRRVRWQKDGYTATASGPDRRRLEEIAKSGGWAFTVTARRGPGRRTEWLLRTRPGLAAGAVLFFVLLRFLGGFVWCIDYGAMDTDLHAGVRTMLADCGIHEGVYLTKPLLQAAQAQALRRSETFGWVSLNFTGGCLSVESTPAQIQTVRDPPPRQGLYAAADGEVLAVEIESGFAVVAVGEQVTAGQSLAVAEKLDRKGNAVPQGAWGRIVARVQKQYTAVQALEYEALVYTGRSSAAETLYLPGYAHTRPAETPLAGEEQTEWLPLRLGRLALPACICRVTTWEQQTQPVRLTDTAAVALAVRACHAQLLRDFPDAEIEAEQRETTTENGTAAAAVTYIFTADIARTRQFDNFCGQ